MIVLLSLALLAGAAAGVARGPVRRTGSAPADHPRFVRRMPALPAIVVTVPDTADALPAAIR